MEARFHTIPFQGPPELTALHALRHALAEVTRTGTGHVLVELGARDDAVIALDSTTNT